MVVVFLTTLLASLLLIPFFCSLTRSDLLQTHLDNAVTGDRLSPVRKHKGRPERLQLQYTRMMSSNDDTAAMPPPPPPQLRHRSSSSIAQSPHPDAFERLSMEINTPASATSTRPNSMITTFTEEPSEISSPVSRRSLSFEPVNNFLTAVASQERYVLELREALQKAEADLHRLKTYWTQQEAVRKRQEVHTHIEAMRPLTSPTKSTPNKDRFPHRQSLSLEDERKKAMFARPRVPERKVLTGRHTRTLSLLSPGTLANRSPSQTDSDEQNIPTPSSASTTTGENHFKGRPHADSRGTRDDLVNTGKQLVGDLREGLWSFWDDLRQATVGEEAIKEPPARGQGRPDTMVDSAFNDSRRLSIKRKEGQQPSRSPHTRSATIAAIPSTPSRMASSKSNSLGISADGNGADTTTEDGGWSNWDSPGMRTPASGTPKTCNRSDETGKKTRTGPDSEQMGLQPTTPGRETIPWPALHKLSPINLQRTASNLMKEWERSLSPPAEESRKDWIDKYIDGSRKRVGTNTEADRRAG